MNNYGKKRCAIAHRFFAFIELFRRFSVASIILQGILRELQGFLRLFFNRNFSSITIFDKIWCN